jgi:hypothetical protein
MWSSVKLLKSVWLVGLLLSLPHCGYTLNHRLKDSFQYKNGIFVPVFTNRTDEIGAELVFTNALIRELTSRREVLISSRDAGGLELRGEIASISTTPTAYTANGFQGLQSYRRLPSQLGVAATITLSLVDPKSQGVLWTKTFTNFRRTDAPLNRTYDYQAPTSVGPLTQSVVEALYVDIARDMMRDVYDEMVELF